MTSDDELIDAYRERFGAETFGKETGRRPFVNRSTRGKTARKRRWPAQGTKTNVGDPNDKGSQGGKKKR